VTYSLENLVFRAVGCAVNTAARAANGLLETMYPPERPVRCSATADGVTAATDQHPVVADPTPDDAASPPAPGVGSLTELYFGISELELWESARCVDAWAASSECSDNPYYQVHLQDLAARLRDASRSLRSIK
jgi:hypothetical protein